MESILKIENIHKSYGAKEVLKGISLDVKKGEVISVLGPSGCGKSTLLNIIAGILPVDQGTVTLNGKTVTAPGRMIPIEKRDLNMVFQDFALWPHMTARDNILYGLKLHHADKSKMKEKLEDMEALLHIEGLLDQYPAELSGGQQQRVAIARALIMNPSIVLLDEPLCNLDVQLRIEMRTEMAEIFHRLHTTVFHVTHDPSEAFAMADRIVILNQGQIDQIGAPRECYDRPASAVAAGLLGAGNHISAAFDKKENGRTLFSVSGASIPAVTPGKDPDGKAMLCFRPEDAGWNEDQGGIPVSVVIPTFEGGMWRILAKTKEGGEVTFLSDHLIAAGQQGRIQVPEERLYAYAAG